MLHLLPLKQRLLDGETLFATFVKTTSHQTVEVLASAGLDAIVLDAEHAPFGPESLDRCLLAARAGGLPALVRVPHARGDAIQQALDMGAAGVMVPRVDTAAIAAQVVRASRYAGARGFSASPRAGNYGQREMAVHITQSDAQTVVMVQIESMEAVANVAAIAAVPGVDCLFIGPADLAVSMGAQQVSDPRVADAVARVCAAGRDAGCVVGCFVADSHQVPGMQALGVDFFVIGSDQALLKRAARQAVAAVRVPAPA